MALLLILTLWAYCKQPLSSISLAFDQLFTQLSKSSWLLISYLASFEMVRQKLYVEMYFNYASFRTVWQLYCGIASQSNSLHKTFIIKKIQQ